MRRLSNRPVASLVVVFWLAFLLAVAGSWLRGLPEPRVHDEFSYLLAGDTFARGRVANPTHPMWEHFETFHVNSQPTYVSKYPPGQGLALAVGQVLSGSPRVGVWLSFGLMAVAMCWMLRAWVGAGWAFGASAVLACWLGPTYWGYSYWGGAVAAAGGALLWGGLARLGDSYRPRRARDAVLTGVGVAILANSRPYEGLLVAIPACLLFVYLVTRRQRTSVRDRLRTVVVPIGVVLIVTAGLMAEYNRQTTGRALTPPYLVYEARYATAPVFLLQPASASSPTQHETIRQFHTGGARGAGEQRSLSGFASAAVDKLATFRSFFLPVVLAVPLVMLPLALRDRWTAYAAATLFFAIGGMVLASWFFAHYAAPLLGVMAVVYVQCVRWCRRLRVGRVAVGGTFVAVLTVGWLLAGAARLALGAAEQLDARPAPWPVQRAGIEDRLRRAGGQHVVLVRYGPEHSPHREWVYNGADIDGSPVVWARDMGSERNRELLEYFDRRTAWVVTVNDDDGPFSIRSYDRDEDVGEMAARP